MQELVDSPAFVLFAILALGLTLGKVSVKGISLGSSGVLFVALAAGHFGLQVPQGITELGTVLFVYCVGLGVGNRFFGSLCSKGSKLVILSILVVGLAWCITLAGCRLCGLDYAVGAGLFAGACTSTPGLAAALEALQAAGHDTAAVNIGYGVAYPFGVVGVVLFVQVLPRLLKKSLDDTPHDAAAISDPGQITRRVVAVSNPQLMGLQIAGQVVSRMLQCRITRVLHRDMLVPVTPEAEFSEGVEVMMVGTRDQLDKDTLILGSADAEVPVSHRCADESAEVIVLEKSMGNRTLRELDTLGRHGVVVSRISRLGVAFVPTDDTEVVRNDVLTVVGPPERIAEFKRHCRHRPAAIGATDILSLVAGVALGILVGKVSIGGGPDSDGFSLGLAGGPLVVALILGHFGHIGPIKGYMPRPARMLLTDFALMLFLAGAGVSGGRSLVATLQQQGLPMLLVGMAVTVVPLLFGYLLARKWLHLPLPEVLGGICGSMTSTPALGAITGKTDRQSPVIAYATAYPAALILMAVLAKCMVSLL